MNDYNDGFYPDCEDEEIIRPYRREVKNGVLIERFKVDIPADSYDDKAERDRLAINTARDLCDVYRMPCEWQVLRSAGDFVYVERRSNA